MVRHFMVQCRQNLPDGVIDRTHDRRKELLLVLSLVDHESLTADVGTPVADEDSSFVHEDESCLMAL